MVSASKKSHLDQTNKQKQKKKYKMQLDNLLTFVLNLLTSTVSLASRDEADHFYELYIIISLIFHDLLPRSACPYPSLCIFVSVLPKQLNQMGLEAMAVQLCDLG